MRLSDIYIYFLFFLDVAAVVPDNLETLLALALCTAGRITLRFFFVRSFLSRVMALSIFDCPINEDAYQSARFIYIYVYIWVKKGNIERIDSIKSP